MSQIPEALYPSVYNYRVADPPKTCKPEVLRLLWRDPSLIRFYNTFPEEFIALIGEYTDLARETAWVYQTTKGE